MSDNLLLWLKKQVFKPGVYGNVRVVVENGKVVDLKHEVSLKEADLKKLLTSS